MRIAIIGNAGGGKSRLARKLSETLVVPVREFDHLQWQPGWERTPQEKIERVHRAWIEEPGWIIDGWGSWNVLRERFEKADTIVLIDFPIHIHYWWALKRHVAAIRGQKGSWPP